MGSYGDYEPEAPKNVDPVRLAALKLVTSSAIPGALASLARLNVFDILAHESDLTAPEIATQITIPPNGKAVNVEYLSRLLRMMSGKSILRETVDLAKGERRYALEPIAHYLVDDRENGSFKNLLLMYQHWGYLGTWAHIDASVVDDSVQPFARANGGLNAWEFQKRHKEFDTIFNKAMAGHSKVYMRAVLEAYHGFDDVRVLVDVGGGFGSSLSLITAKYPHVRGINFDQPHVIDACPDIPRVEHVAGNMFESVPGDGDAIFMKYILHDWNDEACLKILRNCYKALPANGKVIALDNQLPEIIHHEDGADDMALQVDIHMLAYNDSGARERTESETRKLALAAGFEGTKVICRVDLLAVTEFYKA
jgi:hypothetical protein